MARDLSHPAPPLCSQGATGVCFCRCNTCIIVGYHDDKIQPGSCQMTVGKLADFLKEPLSRRYGADWYRRFRSAVHDRRVSAGLEPSDTPPA